MIVPPDVTGRVQLVSAPCWEGAASAVLALTAAQVSVITLQLVPGFCFGQKTQGKRGCASFLVSWEVEMLQNNLCTRLCLVLPLWLLMFHTASSVSGTSFGREYIW